MATRKKLPPLPPRGPDVLVRDKAGASKQHVPPTEHEEARAAAVARLVTSGVETGLNFDQLVAEVMKQFGQSHGLKRAEVVDAIRREEEQLRTEISRDSQKRRTLAVRQLENASRKLYLHLQQAKDVAEIARLERSFTSLMERRAKLEGWDEPDRVRVEVMTSPDRLLTVFEHLDEEEYTDLAARQLEDERLIASTRKLLGLPAHPLVVVPEEE